MNKDTSTAIGFGALSLSSLGIALMAFALDSSVAGKVLLATASAAALVALVSWFVAAEPDDDTNDPSMSLTTRRSLALYLIATGVLLMGALTWLLWFDFTPPGKFPPPAGTTPIPFPKGAIETWWWGRVEISRNIQLFLLALVAGALGSYIQAIKSLADYLGSRTAKTSWFWFYITRPFLGAALAGLFYAVMRGGFMNGSPAEANSVSPFGVIAICGMVGMFADRASKKLSEVFETLFKTDESRADKLTDLQITTNALPDGQVGRQYPATQLDASGGGAGQRTWNADGLPAGLTCGEGGAITGVPTAAAAGVRVTITLKLAGATATKTLPLTIT